MLPSMFVITHQNQSDFKHLIVSIIIYVVYISVHDSWSSLWWS